MKNNYAFIFLTLSLIVLHIAPSFAKECKPHRPSTRLDYNVEKTEYLRMLDANQLTMLHSATRSNKVLGLAGGEVGMRFEATFEAKEVTNKLYCLNVKKINATLYAKPQVHIAKNFRRGTCEYNAVLKHENKHVDVLKRAHKEYLPQFRKHLRVTSKKIPVLPPMSLAQANQRKHQLIAEIRADLQAYLNEITEEVDKRQKKVDTEEEYQRVHDRCRRWEKRLNE